MPALRGATPVAGKAAPARETSALIDRARVQAKEILLAAWYDTYGRMPDMGKPGDVKKLVRHYERCVWGYRAVEWVAGNASMLRIGARLLSDPGQERENEPVLALLNQRANPYERAMFFRHRLVQQLLTSPRGVFVERDRNRRNDVAAFHLLPPGRTRAVPGRSRPGQPAKFVDYFEVKPADGYGEPRPIPVENVIWIRLPHPDDPYRSMTPFEAADMSLELDYFARLYNRNFMHNDGRPGGVLGIDSDLDDPEMDRVERKFGGGVQDAGRLAVVAGGLSYVDTSATPRDAQYVEVARVAKIEVLAAVGVSEASLGNSSDRTFSNAEVDDESSWLNQLPRLRFVADAFDEDSDDDVQLFHDVSTVDALGRAERRDREEMRKEVDGGQRSYDEYRVARGLDPYDTPATRALWVPSGRTPVASPDDDQADLAAFATPAAPAPAAPPEAGTGDDRPPLPANAPGRGDPDAEKRDKTAGREPPFSGGAPESKAEPKPPDAGSTYEPDEDDGLDVERTLAAALLASAAKLVGIAEARLAGPKVLMHTRHWKPPGDRAFDAAKVVQAARWTDAGRLDAERVLGPAAATAAEDLLAALAGPEQKALPKEVAAAVKAAVDEASSMVGKSAARQAELLLDLIAETEAGGASVPEIVAAIRKFGKGQKEWAAGVAVQAVTAALEGARAAAAAKVGKAVARRWRARGDDKVRPTHRKANGQERALREAFDVGGVPLRYPGDPRAPFKETANCRCRVQYRSAATGRFVPKPKGQIDRRPMVKVRLVRHDLPLAPVQVKASRIRESDRPALPPPRQGRARLPPEQTLRRYPSPQDREGGTGS